MFDLFFAMDSGHCPRLLVVHVAGDSMVKCLESRDFDWPLPEGWVADDIEVVPEAGQPPWDPADLMWRTTLQTPLRISLQKKPDFVLFHIGTRCLEDITGEVNDCVGDMEKLLILAKKCSPSSRMIVCSPLERLQDVDPVFEATPSYNSMTLPRLNNVISQFCTLLKELCCSLGAIYLDLRDTFSKATARDVIALDGIHYTYKGYRLLAETFVDFITDTPEVGACLSHLDVLDGDWPALPSKKECPLPPISDAMLRQMKIQVTECEQNRSVKKQEKGKQIRPSKYHYRKRSTSPRKDAGQPFVKSYGPPTVRKVKKLPPTVRKVKKLQRYECKRQTAVLLPENGKTSAEFRSESSRTSLALELPAADR